MLPKWNVVERCRCWKKFEVIWTRFAHTSFVMQNLVQKMDLEVVLKWLDEMN
jgi:hypothetical protein